jgi:hypothetical protein
MGRADGRLFVGKYAALMQLENRWGFPGLVHVDLEREIPECVPKTVGAGERFNCLADCLLAFGAVMLTSKEYVQQAKECLRLANASSDVYVKEALTELASDFKAMAEDLEQRNGRWRETDHGLDGKEDNCEADVKWMNGYALRPYHKLSKAHQYPAWGDISRGN